MKTTTIALILGGVALAGGVALYARGRRAIATTDPAATAAPVTVATVKAAVVAGAESVRESVIKPAVVAVTSAVAPAPTPIDQSSAKSPARTDLIGADYTAPVISLREAVPTKADLAIAGLYNV